MSKIVDGRTKACPIPVIMTKKEIDKGEYNKITTIVDNEVAKENVSKLAQSLGLKYDIEDVSDKEFHINITLNSEKKDDNKDLNTDKDNGYDLEDLTIAFSKDIMGGGNRSLGNVLIKSFIYTLSEASPYPKTLIFFNEGVNLTCKGSEVLEDLEKLESKGVEIISCGTCLDFLGKQDLVQIGSISNMYTIYEKLREPKKNIII